MIEDQGSVGRRAARFPSIPRDGRIVSEEVSKMPSERSLPLDLVGIRRADSDPETGGRQKPSTPGADLAGTDGAARRLPLALKGSTQPWLRPTT
jgi:hypothetical protein